MSKHGSEPSPLHDPAEVPPSVSRSDFLARLGIGAGALFGSAVALLDGLRSALPAFAARPAASISSTMPAVSRIGLFLGNIATLSPNKALAYKDPKTGDPALLIRLGSGQVVSYDVVCPHQGCSVAYDPTHRLLVCPCHGARFDPTHRASPLAGPVSQPLITLPIRVDAQGNVYALDARPGSKVNRLHAAPPPSAGDDGSGDDGSGDDGGDTPHHKSKRSRKRGGDN